MLIMGEGADDDLWVSFQITVWLQECFDGRVIVAWSGTRAARWRSALSQFLAIEHKVSCSSLGVFSGMKL